MKVLLLNGANPGDSTVEIICKLIVDELKKNKHELVQTELSQVEIKSCMGCFGCWVKTPGICVIDDQGREIAREAVQSDLVILVTPITFGGYSYQLKKALDRLIPIISPFFKKIKGEIHHHPRYERYPSFISIGILSEMNQELAETFKNLVKRNAINLHSPIYLSSVLLRNQTTEEFTEEIGKLLPKVEVQR